MANSFSQLQDIKARIVRDLSAQQTQLTSAVGAFTNIAANLTTMQTTYSGWATEVNQLVTDNPGDEAALALQAEKDFLVAEFASAKTSAQAYETAVNGV